MIFDAFGNLQNNDGTPINQPLNGALPDLSNEVVSPTQIKGGASSNFKTGVSGYFLDNTTGDVEFGSGKFRGDITGASGTFSGDLTGGTITGSTIKNQSGTVVIDSTGLNSSTNFSGVEVSSAATGSTSSTSYVDVSGSQMNTFTLARNTNVFVYMTFAGRNDQLYTDVPRSFNAQIYDIDTATQVSFLSGTGVSVPPGDYSQGVYYGKILTLSAGNHTFKMQYKANGGGHAVWSFFNEGYIILGN